MDTGQAHPAARLALEDLELLDARLAGLCIEVCQRGYQHYAHSSQGLPCFPCTGKEEGGWNFQVPMEPSESVFLSYLLSTGRQSKDSMGLCPSWKLSFGGLNFAFGNGSSGGVRKSSGWEAVAPS